MRIYSYLALLFMLIPAQAMAVVYEENFVEGESYETGTPEGDRWNVFTAEIGALATGNALTNVRLSGSNDPTGMLCTDPVAVNQLGLALSNYPDGVAVVDCNGNTWRVGDCGDGQEISVNTTGICGCPVGYTLRPTINPDNPNWGGINTDTCFGPTQTIKLEFDGEFVEEADLAISKTDDVDPVSAGNELVYTVTVGNIGLLAAENVVATDTLPAGVTLVSTTGCSEDPAGVPTCSLGTIEPGGSAVYTITVVVDPSTRGIITNNASVTTTSLESNLLNNSTTEDTDVVAVSDLAITKLASSDVAGSGSGQTLDYTIEVSNIGPSDATNVLVTDTLSELVTLESTAGCLNDPGGVPDCQLGTIAVGDSVTYTITVNLMRADATLVNTASVDSDSTDPNSDNSTAVAVVEVSAIPIPTLGVMGLALLILLMGGIGWMNTRRV